MSLLLLNVVKMKLFQRKFKIIFYIMMTLQDVIAEIQWGTCLLEPFFVSEWSMMRAQDDLHSEIEFEHGIGDWPAIVDVQIKPIHQAGNDVFVFTSSGSFQHGDDQNLTYGGIVYIYDKTKIKLFAPNKKGGNNTGTIISIGDRSGNGGRIRNENEVMVRTRVWRYIDVPKPDFETDWMYISSGNSSLLEFDHKLTKEPEYVSVQIKLSKADRIDRTDASSQDKTQTILWGGANYAYDSKNIRIWIPYFGSTDGIYSIANGWDKNSSLVYNSGKIKVRAWLSLRANQTSYTNERRLHSSRENPVIRRLQTPINQDGDIFSVLVKANDVDNSGFLFPVSGTIQHNITSSNNRNRLIYAYSELNYKIWLGNVKEPSFQHKIIQRSSRTRNNIHDISAVDIVIHLWKPYAICHSTFTMISTGKIESTSSNFTLSMISNEGDNTTNFTDKITAETTDSTRVSYTTQKQATSNGSISGTMIVVIVTVVVLVSLVMAGLIAEIIIRIKKE